MLAEEPAIHLKTRKLVQQLSAAPDQHDDLVQDALLHLWQTETQNPGQTLSWYCQSCCFHVQHQVDRGCSIDSPKRRHLKCPLGLESPEPLSEGEALATGNTPLEYCSALDVVEQIASRLDGKTRATFRFILLGYGVREVATRVGLSPAAIVKHRLRIASAAARLGIPH